MGSPRAVKLRPCRPEGGSPLLSTTSAFLTLDAFPRCLAPRLSSLVPLSVFAVGQREALRLLPPPLVFVSGRNRRWLMGICMPECINVGGGDMILTAFGFVGAAGGEASPPRACSRLLFVPAPLGAGWLSVRGRARCASSLYGGLLRLNGPLVRSWSQSRVKSPCWNSERSCLCSSPSWVRRSLLSGVSESIFEWRSLLSFRV